MWRRRKLWRIACSVRSARSAAISSRSRWFSVSRSAIRLLAAAPAERAAGVARFAVRFGVRRRAVFFGVLPRAFFAFAMRAPKQHFAVLHKPSGASTFDPRCPRA